MAKYLRIKDPVKVRINKKANGTRSIYFIIYINGVRYYEYLRMYLVPENTEFDKNKNKETMMEVNSLKSQLVEDINNCQAKKTFRLIKSKIPFKRFMHVYIEQKVENKSKARNQTFSCLLNHLNHYIKKERLSGIRIGDINVEFCKGFQSYLETVSDTRMKKLSVWAQKKGVKPKTISEETASTYFEGLDLALSWGVKHCYLVKNPIGKMHLPLKRSEVKDSYLTVEELRVLAKAPCPNMETKRVFFFVCLSGFHLFDIMDLSWADITNEAGVYSAHIINKKFKKQLDQAINDAAMIWFPERAESKDTEKIFNLRKKSAIENHMHNWHKKSGLGKPISFHVARSTYSNFISSSIDLLSISLELGLAVTDIPDILNKALSLSKRHVTSMFGTIFSVE